MSGKCDWCKCVVGVIWLLMILMIPLVSTFNRDPYHPENKKHHHVHDVYKGCGYIKNCVKLCPPETEGCKHCILHHNCPALVTLQYYPKKKIIRSQMLITHLGVVDEYISMGLSKNGQMQKSPFVACMSITNYNGSGSIHAAQMMLDGFTRLDNTVKYIHANSNNHFFHNREIRVEAGYEDDETSDRLNLNEFEAADGPSLKCSFEWKSKFSITHAGDRNPTNYDLLNEANQKNAWHIIAARGSAGDPILGRYILRGHTRLVSGRTATPTPLVLTKVPTGTLSDDYDEYYDGENADNHFRGFKAGRSQQFSSSRSQIPQCNLIALISMLLSLCIYSR